MQFNNVDKGNIAMLNMYGQFDMRSMSGVTWKSLREESTIASSPSQGHHRETSATESQKEKKNFNIEVLKY